jgi:epoxyqueuosine reductase QueG
LGEIGLNGLFLTPEFGSRQRFHMILTDAEIEPTPLFEGHICDACGKCAQSCPLGAINVEKTTEINICGKKMQVADINYEICKTCKNGACANRFAVTAKPDRIAALCNRTCVSHLEQNDLLSNKFENPFRQRKAWSVGKAGSVNERNVEAANVLGGSFSKDGNRGNR